MKKIVITLAIIIVVLFIVLIIVVATNNEKNSTSNTDGNLAAFSQSDSEVVIDFSACPETGFAKITTGSDALELMGQDGDNCLMRYGADPDDPNWDGSYERTCEIPISLGQVTFSKQDGEVDYRQIRKYCIVNDNNGTSCSDINDVTECKLRSNCLVIDYCSCTTDKNRAEKCDYDIPIDQQCICGMGGFERCEVLNCPAK